jgi:hypothetical protein
MYRLPQFLISIFGVIGMSYYQEEGNTSEIPHCENLKGFPHKIHKKFSNLKLCSILKH